MASRCGGSAIVRACSVTAALLAGCGGAGGGTDRPAGRPGQDLLAAGFQPSGAGGARAARSPSRSRSATERPAADAYKTGAGPHTGCSPDHRPRRSRLHHPPAPTGQTRRPAAPDRHVPRSRPLQGARRRLSRHAGRPAELPAVPDGRRSRAPTTRSRCPRSNPTWSSTATTSTCRATRRARDPGAVRQRRRDRPAAATRPTFVPWFGALAHAIFFQRGIARLLPHARLRAERAELRHARRRRARAGSPAAPAAPGKLTVGVLLPEPGTWRLFLQTKLGGRIVTAPFTLKVAS